MPHELPRIMVGRGRCLSADFLVLAASALREQPEDEHGYAGDDEGKRDQLVGSAFTGGGPHA
jgi:hypothetical protein